MESLAKRKIHTANLLAAYDLTPALIEDLDARIPYHIARQLWNDAARLVDDPDLGLHVAMEGKPGTFAVLAYLMQAQANLGDALRQVVKYHRLVVDIGEVELVVDGPRARLVIHTHDPRQQLFRHAAEGYLAGWVRRGRKLTGVDWNPVAVRFRHSRPESIETHREVFRAPVSFGHVTDELELDSELLELPFATADASLARILDRRAEEMLERLPPVDDFVATVRKLIATTIEEETPSLERLATHLRTSARTLQRRLAREGLSLRSLVDDARRELAVAYLRRVELSIAEITERLGFQAVPSFHRAFRRWTGVTPNQYRQRERP